MLLHLSQIGCDHVGIAQHVCRCSVGNVTAKIQHRDAVGHPLHQMHVVVDDHDGQAMALKPL